MDSLFSSLKNFVKIKTVVTDNNIFRLHYKVTVPILLVFSLLVTSRQYIGDPIDCISKDDIPEKVLETFCWIHSTFSVEDSWFKKVGVEVPYPGVDTYRAGQRRVYHSYYQWVCFVLFFQAMLFYVPRYFWKCMEGGRVRALIADLSCPVDADNKRDLNKRLLVDYFVANFGNHGGYSNSYFFSEVLNAINVIGQMYLMDAFLGGLFSSYGTEVISFTNWDWSLRYDPMIHRFPRMTKCTFHRFGSSGDVQKHDALCILPINIINEKIYVFLWFWFVGLAVLSCAAVAYRILLQFSSSARFRTLIARVNLSKKEKLERILKKCKVGDWFMLHMLAKNMDSLNFRDFIEELSTRFEEKNSNDV